MTITKVTYPGNRIVYGDSFDPSLLSVTVKMGSSEYINKTESACTLRFVPGDWSSYSAAYTEAIRITGYTTLHGVLGTREVNPDTGEVFFRSVYSHNEFTISKGATKTLTSFQTNHGSGYVVLDNCTTPEPADIINYDKFNARRYVNEMGGSQRIKPLTVIVTVGDSIRTYNAVLRNAFFLAEYRAAPVINSVVMTDNHPLDPLSKFGGYINSKSIPEFTISFNLDEFDPDLTSTHALWFSIDGKGYDYRQTLPAGSTTCVFELSHIPEYHSGEIRYGYRIDDSHGGFVVRNGTFMSYQYSDPTITPVDDKPIIERFSRHEDDTPYTDPIGEMLRMALTATASSVNGLNATSLSVTWDGKSGQPIAITSSSDGLSYTLNETGDIDETRVLMDEFANGLDWNFEIMLTDFFHPSTSPIVKRVIVEKGDGVFDVSEYGVAVGQLSTGTATKMKFETKHPAYLYGGIEDGGWNYSSDEIACGVWIDGKTIYRKTVYSPSYIAIRSADGTDNIGDPITDVDTVIDLCAVSIGYTKPTAPAMPEAKTARLCNAYANPANNTYKMDTYYSYDDKCVKFRHVDYTSSTVKQYMVYATMWYTKL